MRRNRLLGGSGPWNYAATMREKQTEAQPSVSTFCHKCNSSSTVIKSVFTKCSTYSLYHMPLDHRPLAQVKRWALLADFL